MTLAVVAPGFYYIVNQSLIMRVWKGEKVLKVAVDYTFCHSFCVHVKVFKVITKLFSSQLTMQLISSNASLTVVFAFENTWNYGFPC